MDFFKNIWTKIVSWVLLAVCVVVLILGGSSAGDISRAVELTAAIVAAVAALVAFITERIKE